MRLRWGIMALGAAAVLAVALLLQGAGLLRERTYVIGVLNHGIIAEQSLAGFKSGLAVYGYPEGARVTYHYRGPLLGEALDFEAVRLVGLKPDLLLALSTPAAKAGMKAISGTAIPLVFAPASDPVGAGLAETLGRPGRNATGVTFGVQEPLRLQWLKRLVPSIRTVVVPFNPDDLSPRLSVERIKPVAQELGLRLDLRHVRSVQDLDEVMNALPADTDAVFIPTDALVASNLSRILLATMQKGIPVSSVEANSVRQGALMSYGFELKELGRQGARIAAQVLGGVPAGDLPVETAEFRLSVNLDTVQRLNLAIPDSLLRQADIVRGTEGGDAR
jgi:putative ABC transport system substrate-binding protein